MIKGVDVAVYEAIHRAVENRLDTGIITSFGLAEQAVDYVRNDANRELLPDTVRARIEQLRSDIVNGRIATREMSSFVPILPGS